jgi:hypothetical protein
LEESAAGVNASATPYKAEPENTDAQLVLGGPVRVREKRVGELKAVDVDEARKIQRGVPAALGGRGKLGG